MSSLVRWFAALLSAALAASCMSAAPVRSAPRVLIFSHTTGYRHASIEPGIAAIQGIGARNGWVVDATEDVDVFARGRLDGYDALVLLSNTSNRRDPATEWFVGARRVALQAFVHRGGGIVGIHAAADSHYHWPWYRRMIGAAFDHHPPGTPVGQMTLVDLRHPATHGLPPSVARTDEWYYCRR